jgi:nucleoside-diphosphate kinase
VQELSFFFPTTKAEKEFSPKAVATMDASTCCIVKPHVLRAGNAGKLISEIQRSGFNISGLCSFHLKYEHAEEFYEIYKGVVQDYTVSWVDTYRTKDNDHGSLHHREW